MSTKREVEEQFKRVMKELEREVTDKDKWAKVPPYPDNRDEIREQIKELEEMKVHNLQEFKKREAEIRRLLNLLNERR